MQFDSSEINGENIDEGSRPIYEDHILLAKNNFLKNIYQRSKSAMIYKRILLSLE